MAVEIDATPAGAQANSYCTLAEAEAYHETRLHNTAWTAADDATKKKALIWATRLLDEQIEWEGFATHFDTQVLQWPRMALYYPGYDNVYDMLGRAIGEDEIPQRLKNAQAELALYLISADTTAALQTDSFSFNAQTGDDSASGLVTVNVAFVNDLTVTSPTINTNEDVPATGNVLAGAVDSESAIITATAGTFATPNGSVSIASDGSYT